MPDREAVHPVQLLQLLRFDNGTAGISCRLGWQMDEQEVAYAIGWLLVASGVLAGMLASLTRFGYRATTAGLLLSFVGLLLAGHTWPAVVVLVLTLARFGYHLYLRYKV
jgi:hypothetical protein